MEKGLPGDCAVFAGPLIDMKKGLKCKCPRCVKIHREFREGVELAIDKAAIKALT